jgi:predicted aspartyl protease
MKLTLVDNLPFSQVTVAYRGVMVTIDNVLIDTGSATTILAADRLTAVHITPEPNDTLHTIRGVGGTEVVFTRQVDYVQIGERQVPNFEVEVGGIDYGFEINGILGMDFLRQAGAIINLQDLSLTFVD